MAFEIWSYKMANRCL